ILGVCGKLMAGVANLAVEKGFQVVGIDKCFQPPMSQMLSSDHIELMTDYPSHFDVQPGDHVIVGNQITRSLPLIQKFITDRVKLYSAPEWLMEHVLRDRYVIAVTGSHGKTTITAMIAWVLSSMGEDPGYLIGGVSQQLKATAKLGTSQYFVIEADEYDTAFFDKRPKFLHYWPVLLVISHIDYDHADIYPNFRDLIKQYKFLLRLLPSHGKVIATGLPEAVIDQIASFKLPNSLYGNGGNDEKEIISNIHLKIPGAFNLQNALACYLTCRHLGFEPSDIYDQLSKFQGARRRQTLMLNGVVQFYDDFAHHPKEVSAVCKALSKGRRLIVVYHPATYTQRMGLMDEEVVAALSPAHHVVMLIPPKHEICLALYEKNTIDYVENEDDLAKVVMGLVQEGDTVVVMSAYYLANFWSVIIEGESSSWREDDCNLPELAL
ncbi:MAG: Mur ligase family protein, partial [Pseudomonadota bacterium]|nr:Mur ligase family protein [Pseudomonadota bacterium]